MTAAVTDFSQYQRMRLDADSRDPAVLREVAGQFEALFLEILLKDMRNASLGDPIFGQSQQHDLYREMLDKQFAVEMSSGRGIGIADMLVAQLGGDTSAVRPSAGEYHALPLPVDITRLPAMTPPTSSSVRKEVSSAAVDTGRWADPTHFARDVWPHAERAGRLLDIAPQSLLAQAALETGWGSRIISRPDGSSSLNLFGIKAGGGWDGDSVAQATLEYRDGVAEREIARFRAYPDLAAAFDDYVAFIGGKPRYTAVPGSGSDARAFGGALQQAGYATDPAYAEKIARVAGGETMQKILAALEPDTPATAATRVSDADLPTVSQRELSKRKPGTDLPANPESVTAALKLNADLPTNSLRVWTSGTWPRN